MCFRFSDDGAPASGAEVQIGVYVDPLANPQITPGNPPVVIRLRDGLATPLYSASSVQADVEEHHETGWWIITFEADGCGIDIILTADLDECTSVNDCDENAVCYNDNIFVSGNRYTCRCLDTHYDEMTNSNNPTPPAIAGTSCTLKSASLLESFSEITIANDIGMLPLGLRFEDILLYEDEHCASDAVAVSVVDSISMENHEPSLVNDASSNTAFWSQAWDLAPRGASVNLRPISPQPIKSVKIMQPDTDDAILVSMKLRSHGSLDQLSWKHVLHQTLGSRGDGLVSLNVTGDLIAESSSSFVQSWQYTGECTTLQCGIPNYVCREDHLAQYESVASACQCKQLCLDHVDEGCRAWRFQQIGTCYLHTALFDINADSWVVKHGWRAGGIDIILTGLSPQIVQGANSFSLTVSGFGLPESQRVGRIKIVHGDEQCGTADVATTVSGIRCTGLHASVCHPAPSAASKTEASWSISIIPSPTKQVYKVCYCPGGYCKGTSWHTAGDITVSAAEYVYTFSSTPTRGAQTELQVVEAADIDLWKRPVHAWKIFVVPHNSDGCYQDHDDSFVVAAANPLDYSSYTSEHRRARTWHITVDQSVLGGNYSVCLCYPDVAEEKITESYDAAAECALEVEGSRIPLVSSSGASFISITHDFVDVSPSFFHHQNSWGASVSEPKTFAVRGVEVGQLKSSVGLLSASGKCPPVSNMFIVKPSVFGSVKSTGLTLHYVPEHSGTNSFVNCTVVDNVDYHRICSTDVKTVPDLAIGSSQLISLSGCSFSPGLVYTASCSLWHGFDESIPRHRASVQLALSHSNFFDVAPTLTSAASPSGVSFSFSSALSGFVGVALYSSDDLMIEPTAADIRHCSDSRSVCCKLSTALTSGYNEVNIVNCNLVVGQSYTAVLHVAGEDQAAGAVLEVQQNVLPKSNAIAAGISATTVAHGGVTVELQVRETGVVGAMVVPAMDFDLDAVRPEHIFSGQMPYGKERCHMAPAVGEKYLFKAKLHTLKDFADNNIR